MRHVRAARRVTIAAAMLGAGALLLQYAPPASAHTKPTTAPVFTSKTTAKAKVNVAFDFTIKTKGNPVSTITETGTLPFGVHFADNGNGTATLSGTEPLSGNYTFMLEAANGIGTANQTLTLTVTSKLPPIRHVFVIMLENDGYASTFGSPAADPYLATTLPSQGALLENYYATGHFSNDNYDAIVSGQPPNSDSPSRLRHLSNFGAGEGQDAQGIQQGPGCVYPAAVQTVANQLNDEGLTWKGYMEDMGNDPSREAANCGHPSIGAIDPSFTRRAGRRLRHPARSLRLLPLHHRQHHPVRPGRRAARRHRRDPAGTALPGTTGLVTDLASVATTPNLSFITPNLCDDGHDYPCTNQTTPGASSEADIDAWLSTWVPIITSSPAFKLNGLLEITFDEGETPTLDTTACCGETPGPAADAGATGSRVRAAARSGPSSCHRSSHRARRSRPPTTTTRRWPRSRTCSDCPGWARPRRSRPPSTRASTPNSRSPSMTPEEDTVAQGKDRNPEPSASGGAPPVRLGITTPVVSMLPGAHADWEVDGSIDEVATIATTADRLGYHHLTCSEHVVVPTEVAKVRGGRYWDPLATFGYLAAVTTRIRLATNVLVLGYHHPLEIAKRYGTLDQVAGGRVILGLGVGSLQEEFELLGVPFDDRGRRGDDALAAPPGLPLRAAAHLRRRLLPVLRRGAGPVRATGPGTAVDRRPDRPLPPPGRGAGGRLGAVRPQGRRHRRHDRVRPAPPRPGRPAASRSR